MKIVHFFSENFKRLKVVEFDPDGSMVLVTGANEAGKSSVLDAVWITLQHKAAKGTAPDPVRHGESHAKNVLDLGKYVVTRTFRDGKSSLRIETKEGTVVKKPQAVLDDIVGSLSFDPLEFANAKDSDRRQMIQDVFKLDLTDFDVKDHTLREERKEEKKKLGLVVGKLRTLKPPTAGESDKGVSAADLIEKLTEWTQDQQQHDTLAAREIEIMNEVERLEKRIEELKDEGKKAHEDMMALRKKHNAEPLFDKTYADDLKKQISNVESHNARAREIVEYNQFRDMKDASDQAIKTFTNKLELNKIERDEAIENADIPINGLEITEDGVLLKGVPFDQISSAQKIKASLAIAIAANPTLRVVRIMDGSLLDSANMKIISDMAKEHDYQIWVERVDETGKVGIVIEDGEIIAKN